MSIVSALAGAQGASSGIINAVSGIAKLFGAAGGSGSFQSQVRQSSWRGVPFITLSAESHFGRRKAQHEYPFRDLPWIEDMGRATRRFNVSGFLVGDDVIAQRKALVAAVEIPGPGELVHGTFGSIIVDLLDSSFIEKWDDERYFEVTLSFVQGGQRIYPAATVSTGNAVQANGAAVNAAASASFLSKALSALKAGAAVVGMAVSTALAWRRTAMALVNDATCIYNAVAALASTPGQFFGPRASSTNSTASPQGASTAQSLAALATVARNAVAQSASNLSSSAALLGSPTDLASAAQTLAATLSASATGAGDAMRLLTTLADFIPSAATPTSAVGTAMATMQDSMGDLCRRAALTELVIASSTYQPTSSNDAANVRTAVSTLLDNEILIAGDQGEDGVFNALRALRASVVQDLTVRGAGLASIQTFNIGASLPAPVVAQRLYRDPNRADELVTEANPPHPAFMPASFMALAS